jgi:PAS domain S-box-containing protein
MNWIDFAWPAISGACLILAGIHALVWNKRRDQLAHLAFVITACSVTAISEFELWLLHAQSTEQYVGLLRWSHVPFAILVISMVAFVHLQLGAGRLWLGILACLLRVASLLPNFMTGVNLNFQEVSALQHVVVWGGTSVVAPIGTANPWMLLGQFSTFLIVIFLVDAIIGSRKRLPVSERRRIVWVCGTLAIFILFVGISIVLAVTRLLGPLPALCAPGFLGVLLVMSYELGGDILRAANLTISLQSTQSSLDRSEQRMEQAVRAANVGLWNRDLVSGDSWFSDMGLQLLGINPESSVDATKLREHVDPEDHQALDKALARAASGDGEYHSEFRVLRPDGSRRWLESLGQIEFNAARTPLRMRGVLVDVTERKHATERFRMLVEASPSAMVVVDQSGRITFSNRQAGQVFGYSRDELVGLNVDRLVPEAYQHDHTQDRAAFNEHPDTRTMGVSRNLFGLRKDGTPVPVEIALNPVEIDGSQSVLASIADISERLRLEHESMIQRDELAHLSRVALLAELSGSLAHELNQPLTAILSNAQAATRFLAHSPPNIEEVRESLVNIVESDKRAGEVIRRLRAMLRKDPPEFQRLDLNEVVQDVLRIIRSDLLNRSVETRLELAEDLPLVHGDRVQLQQVLLNLIMNGSDAMAELNGGRILTLRTSTPTSENVEVSIGDVGRGIPEGDLDRIFSPFVTSKREGMGLGLAVCTTIAEAHSGRLWASNNAGAGATLHLELPVA